MVLGGQMRIILTLSEFIYKEVQINLIIPWYSCTSNMWNTYSLFLSPQIFINLMYSDEFI